MRRRNEKLIKALGKAVKETRTELGMTQAALAKAAGLKTKDIDLYEKGLKELRINTFLKLYEVFALRSSSWIERVDEVFKS